MSDAGCARRGGVQQWTADEPQRRYRLEVALPGSGALAALLIMLAMLIA